MDYVSATNQLFGKVLAVMNSAETETLLGYKPHGRWQNKEEIGLPDSSKLWYRVSRQTIANPKTGFGNSETQSRGKFTNYGFLLTELFIPKQPVQLATNGAVLASSLIRQGFRNKTTEGHILFRNPRINELPAENDLYRLNVVVDYQYDEVN